MVKNPRYEFNYFKRCHNHKLEDVKSVDDDQSDHSQYITSQDYYSLESPFQFSYLDHTLTDEFDQDDPNPLKRGQLLQTLIKTAEDNQTVYLSKGIT